MGVRWGTAIIAALAVLIAAPLSVAGLSPVDLHVAKSKDGPYRTSVGASLPDGETRSFWFRARPDSDTTREYTFKEILPFADEVRVRWYRGQNDVTQEIRDDGLPFTLKPDQSKLFRAKATSKSNGGYCFAASLYDESDVFVGSSSVRVNGSDCS
jgi:hypothetical protein